MKVVWIILWIIAVLWLLDRIDDLRDWIWDTISDFFKDDWRTITPEQRMKELEGKRNFEKKNPGAKC